MNWGYVLLCLVLAGLVIYTIIPDLFLHRWGLGSWRRQYGPGVALTFDDGPDPRYTPRILEVLHNHQVKATFFVVGEMAQKYPELVRQILAEGHQIGVHSLQHRYAWFASPWKTAQDWTENVRILENLTNYKVTWMRPPWGTFNLMTWWWLKRNKMRAVLWNVEGHDWKVSSSPEKITARVLQKTNEGTIIVLHDGGGEPGAAENTILALDSLCKRIVQEKKLPLVPLEFPEWGLGKRLVFRIWEKWEHLYAQRNHVERIDARNIFRLEKCTYEGPEIYAEDGTILAKKGDPVAEIHFDNIRLQAKEQDLQKTALGAMRKTRESLPGLARYIADNPSYNNIKVFVAETLFYRGVKGFGFMVQDLPESKKSRGVALLQKINLRIYHPAGKQRNNGRMGDKTRLIWISRERLLKFL